MKHFGKTRAPVLLIHGGVLLTGNELAESRENLEELAEILAKVGPKLNSGSSAFDVVHLAVEYMENSSRFNAGLGSSLQRDGSARLSASIMNGEKQRFSAANLVTGVIHPSKLARALQDREEHVLGPLGSELLARELALPFENTVTVNQARKWLDFLERGEREEHGTVGAVAIDKQGRLAACTSTGGRAMEYPERMSDVGTVAGNYASCFAAISCSGVGEEIIDDAVASRLETRVRDGKSLVQASDATFDEAMARERRYGWIALSQTFEWVLYSTTPSFATGKFDISENTPWVVGLSK